MGILSQEETDRRNIDMLLTQDVPLWLGTVEWSHIVISVNVCVCQRETFQPLFYPPLFLILEPKVLLVYPTQSAAKPVLKLKFRAKMDTLSHEVIQPNVIFLTWDW